MSDLYKNYDESKMTWNEHDREYLAETVDTIYSRVAEVVIAQTDRFFREQEKHKVRLDCHQGKIENHEKRIRRLEMRLLKKTLMWAGAIAIGLLLLSFII